MSKKDWIVLDACGEIVPMSDEDMYFHSRKAAEEKAIEHANGGDSEDIVTVYEAVAVAERPTAKIRAMK